jgi:hypothetical protein
MLFDWVVVGQIVPGPRMRDPEVAEVSAVVEGMDLDALRAGIDWRFQSFAEYMNMLRSRGPYMNPGVLVGPGSSCRGSS